MNIASLFSTSAIPPLGKDLPLSAKAQNSGLFEAFAAKLEMVVGKGEVVEAEPMQSLAAKSGNSLPEVIGKNLPLAGLPGVPEADLTVADGQELPAQTVESVAEALAGQVTVAQGLSALVAPEIADKPAMEATRAEKADAVPNRAEQGVQAHFAMPWQDEATTPGPDRPRSQLSGLPADEAIQAGRATLAETHATPRALAGPAQKSITLEFLPEYTSAIQPAQPQQVNSALALAEQGRRPQVPEQLRAAVAAEGDENSLGKLAADVAPSVSQPVAAASGVASPVPQAMIAGDLRPAAALAAQIDMNATAMPQRHDFEAVVDRLAEAREMARPGHADLQLRHREFGHVSLQFEMAGQSLKVAMSCHDAGFAPAVQAALAERPIAGASDALRSDGQPSRQDSPGQQASAQSGAQADPQQRHEHHSRAGQTRHSAEQVQRQRSGGEDTASSDHRRDGTLFA